MRIPIAAPDLSGREEEYVSDAIKSTWISSRGKYITRFEKEFAGLCSVEFASAVSNGTVALHLVLHALGLRPGDEVLVPSLTYVATANAVRYLGAEPVFVDIDPDTWCIDPKRIEENITQNTRGIIAVHLYGHPADMDAINHLAGVHGLWVVEDAAEAHLAKYKGRPTGGLADAGTFSFYGNKIFTSGEGGAVTVNNASLNLRLRTLRGQGVDPDRQYYFPVTGYNYRLTNIACALLCAQLERRDEIIGRRRALFQTYHRSLNNIQGIGFQPIAEWAEPAPWLFCITVDADKYGHSSGELMQFLKEKGVETRPFFIPLHTLPPFRKQALERGDRLEVTSTIAAAGINLPTFSLMSDQQVFEIANYIRGYRR